MKITVNNWLKHWIADLYPSMLRILGHGGYACNNHHTRNWFDFTCLLLSLGDLALFIYVEISQALKGYHTFPLELRRNFQNDWLDKSWKFKV